MKGIAIVLLIVLFVLPAFLAGFLVTPWFFLLLLGLVFLFPFALAPKEGESRWSGLAIGLTIVAVIVAIPIVILAISAGAEFLLFLLIMTAPLLYLGFKAE
jgi:hypothetical protein